MNINSEMSNSLVIDMGIANKKLRLPEPFFNVTAKTAIVLMVLSAVMAGWGNMERFEDSLDWLKGHRVSNFYVLAGKALFFVNVAVLLWRVLLVARYRPVAPCRDEELPICTVVIPAYNEGNMVVKTLHSVAQSDYPADKLQIIAVDDGSKDDTWYWIQHAAGLLGTKIETIRLEENGGKKKALYEGFIRSKGDIIVTIDSDSIIDADAIRCMVSPFCKDKRVGAVAGSVKVFNKDKGMIPKMLDVSFAFSFDFIRASQSEVDTVFCTPGALSAYRKAPLMVVLDEWMAQTFMGKPAKIGEDRAMTNAILREGHHVKFQSNAIVHTEVPVEYSKLCNMFLRWARSNIRETIVMGKFIFTKFRETPALGARVNFLLSAIDLTIVQVLLVGLLCCILWHPSVFVSQIIFCASLSSLIPASFYFIRRFNTDALWAIPYGIFWVFGLSWITMYSLCTVGNDKWLTREIKSSNLQSQAQAA